LESIRALYNYDGKEPGDLKFSKGDIIILRRQVDENWFHGEMGGIHGFFPTNFVQVIKPLPQPPPQCKALYDFELKDKEADKDCLPFSKVGTTGVVHNGYVFLTFIERPFYYDALPPPPPPPPQSSAGAAYSLATGQRPSPKLRKGEMFLVLERCQDGWFKGTSMHTGKIGVFPGNYMSPVSRWV
uniref:SH3 domain-containing protein n=1 Tax=Periophthalmus magnuspinnatus TaxID=409849 RepID=A0A3B4AD11_9GOBI